MLLANLDDEDAEMGERLDAAAGFFARVQSRHVGQHAQRPLLDQLVSASNLSDQALANDGTRVVNDSTRVADDVVLTNVIGFDVKVWDPDVNAYVDLGYQVSNPKSRFAGGGNTASQLAGTAVPGGVNSQCVYDTGCFSYENEGIYHLDKNGNPQVDTPGGNSTNGFDDDGNGIVDDKTEQLTSPPYPVPFAASRSRSAVSSPTASSPRDHHRARFPAEVRPA